MSVWKGGPSAQLILTLFEYSYVHATIDLVSKQDRKAINVLTH